MPSAQVSLIRPSWSIGASLANAPLIAANWAGVYSVR